MITDEQKAKSARVALFNSIMVGFGNGLAELFGEAAGATVDEIGAGMVDDLEHALGHKIGGEDPQSALSELARVVVDECGMCQNASFEVTDNRVMMHVEGCMSLPASQKVIAEGNRPFLCIPMMMAKSILARRLGQRVQYVDYKLDMDHKRCDLEYRLI